MLRHYVEFILPNGLKAQVVAYSRLAAVRYHDALFARPGTSSSRRLSPWMRRRDGLEDLELVTKPRKVASAVRAWRNLDLLTSIEFEPIISPDNNDDPGWKQWTDASKIESRIARFKKPLVDPDAKRTDPLAFLVVKSMLITGFDAPIEGVMYLDRSIREAELLQAIARVNRPRRGKAAGIVVDYYGVARHLKEALAAYSAEDIEGALQSLKDEIPKLRDRRDRCANLFESRGVHDLSDTEACVVLLIDERLRAEFTVKLKQFLDTLDLVLPRPEGLPFVKDAKTLAFIYARARNRYREGMPVLGKDHRRQGPRAHRRARHLARHRPKDPADLHHGRRVRRACRRSRRHPAPRHQRWSTRSGTTSGSTWIRIPSTTRSSRSGSKQSSSSSAKTGINSRWRSRISSRRSRQDGRKPRLDSIRKHRDPSSPFSTRSARSRVPSRSSDLGWLAGLTIQLVDHIRSQTSVVGFWSNAYAREVLRGQIFTFLDDYEIVPFEDADAVADRLMELAKANQAKLVTA